MHESCARRAETTIAPQALTLLNSELILGSAKSFAGQLLKNTTTDDLPKLIQQAYLRTFSRKPESDEVTSAVVFIKQQARVIAEDHKTDAKTSLKAAFVDFCHALLNANEFVYLE